MKSFLKYWLPLLIWLGVIFRRLDQCYVRRAYVAIYCSVLALVETGHVAEGNLDNSRCCSQMRARYRIRGSSSSAMASPSFSIPALRAKTLMVVGAVLLGCALFAASDEFHQTFVTSRTPSVRDVLLDVAGALLGLLIGASFARRHPKNNPNHHPQPIR